MSAKHPISKWTVALVFAAFGYLLAVIAAAPSFQQFLERCHAPTWIVFFLVPIATLTSMYPIDPDASMIYILFGGSNAILYGVIGLLIGNWHENLPRYDNVT